MNQRFAWKLIRTVAFLAALFAIFTLSGCATPAKTQAMVVQPQVSAPAYSDALKSAFRVTGVNGGKSTNPLWTSKVGNDDFRQALEKRQVRKRAPKILANYKLF